MDFKYDVNSQTGSIKLTVAETRVLSKATLILRALEKLDPNFTFPEELLSVIARIGEDNRYSLAPPKDEQESPNEYVPDKNPAATAKPQRMGHGEKS